MGLSASYTPSPLPVFYMVTACTDLGLQLLGVVLQSLGSQPNGLVHLRGPVDHVHTQHHLPRPLLDPLNARVLCIRLGRREEEGEGLGTTCGSS